MENQNETIPFNWDEYAKGGWVAHEQNGKPILEITYFESAPMYPIAGTSDGEIKTWTRFGYFAHDDQEKSSQHGVLDLYMTRKTKTVFINFFKTAGGALMPGADVFKSPEDSVREIDKYHGSKHLFVIPVKIPDYD